MRTFSFWHFAILGVLVLACIGIYRLARRVEPAGRAADGPSGVGGWLLLLVFGLLIVGPMFAFGTTYSNLSVSEAQYPALLKNEQWLTYKTAARSVISLSCLLSIAAGIVLMFGRVEACVTFARISIWIIGPIAAVVVGVVIPFAVFGTIEMDRSVNTSIASSTMSALIWTAYLARSRRVKSTYSAGEKWLPSLIRPVSNDTEAR